MSFCCPHSREGWVSLGPLSSSRGSTLMTSSTPGGPTSQHIALGAGIQRVDTRSAHSSHPSVQGCAGLQPGGGRWGDCSEALFEEDSGPGLCPPVSVTL